MNFGVDTATRPTRCSRRRTSRAPRPRSSPRRATCYAVLTGRVSSHQRRSAARRDTDEYGILGLGMQRARLRDFGFFVADTWRWKPNFTVNLGLRYDLQLPFYPRNNSYSKATVADVWGLGLAGRRATSSSRAC